MAAPRLLSRSDRSPIGMSRSSAAHELADYSDVREFFRARQRDSQLLDPDRLIESVFLGAMPEDDAEAVLIAWLAVLPKHMDAPATAADLARHLLRLSPGPHSALQHRLLRLLDFVATCSRAGGPITSSESKRKVTP